MIQITMSIQKDILLAYGAELITIFKNDSLFSEGGTALFYYQVLKGEVHMCNYNEAGKIHLQGIFKAGSSFGEPPLFGNFQYPANAIAASTTQVLRLGKSQFFKLLEEKPAIHLNITKVLAQRLFFKARLGSEISINPPEKRIIGLLTHLKKEIHNLSAPFSYEVKMTRQEIADLTGLRVETVIRAIKSLEEAGKLRIVKRKVWL